MEALITKLAGSAPKAFELSPELQEYAKARRSGKRSPAEAAAEFQWISDNRYVSFQKPNPPAYDDVQTCVCDAESKCSESSKCLNRRLEIECDERTCPAGELCMNRRLQTNHRLPGGAFVSLRIGEAGFKGVGVFLNVDVSENALLLEYVGELLNEAETERRLAVDYVGEKHKYLMVVDGGVLDATRLGGLGRFLNHSCDPNCLIEAWNVKGRVQMALFAARVLKAGEELTFDYKFRRFGGSDDAQCQCGSSKCRSLWAKEAIESEQQPTSTSEVDTLRRAGTGIRSGTYTTSRSRNRLGLDPVLDDRIGVVPSAKLSKRRTQLILNIALNHKKVPSKDAETARTDRAFLVRNVYASARRFEADLSA